MDLLINRSAPDRAGLLALVDGVIMPSTAKLPRLVRNDGEPIVIRVFDPSDSGSRDFDEVDISSATVRVGIGLPDLAPTAGTFTVTETTTGNNATSALTFDVAAEILETKLNLLAAVIAAGGVTVARPAPGVYQVTFNEPGIQTARFSANTARLAPLSVATVSRVQIGNPDAQEIVLIQLIQNAYVFNIIADALPAAAATVEHVQEGTSELPDIQRITLNPRPYAGTFDLAIAGTAIVGIPFDVSRAQLQSMVGPLYEVERLGRAEWIVQTVEPGAIADIEVDVTDLTVPSGVKGTLALNTIAIWRTFLATTAKVLTFTLEVQLQFPGESSRTIFQGPVEMSRNVLNLDTLSSATTLGLQTTYSALYGGIQATWSTAITALTGGGTALDAVPTTLLALGARYDFPLNGSVRTFILVAGAADPTDPNGQVAPLDYNAGSNNKHWESAG
jgi:hypothetical protein